MCKPVFLLNLRAENWVMGSKGRTKETRGQYPNFTKKYQIFGTLSIMHAKDTLWTSLFLKIFFRVPKLLFLGDRAVTKM